MTSGNVIHAYSSVQVQSAVAGALGVARSDDELIRKAAFGLAQACLTELRDTFGSAHGCTVVLLVGTGKNGADAMVAGKHLRERGVAVHAIATGGHVDVIGTRHLDVPAIDATDTAGLIQALDLIARADMVVDGIVGDAMVGDLRAPASDLVEAIPDGALVVAVDLPSGVDPDSGAIGGVHVRADVTVTFGAYKRCLLLPPAAEVAGRLVFVDVGITPRLDVEGQVQRLSSVGVAERWPVPGPGDHKYSRGLLGIVAGSERYPGAAVLACLGAFGTGVGIVRYTGPRHVGDLILEHVPEAERFPGKVDGYLLGSGVLDDPDQERAIDEALATGLPCVVDAGAIETCVRRRAAGDRPTSGDRVLLTPHVGELARSLAALGHEATTADILHRPYEHALRVAEAAEVTVLLKGSTTIVVGPDGRAFSQDEGPAWLATAGSGDVLAGIAGALTSAGLSALEVGAMAAFVHGRAAAIAADDGPLRASKIAEHAPGAVRELLAERTALVRPRAGRRGGRGLARAGGRGRGRE
ncbi:NAD(P)H-hydrate epimerase [Promicromonospora xylanilytica]